MHIIAFDHNLMDNERYTPHVKVSLQMFDRSKTYIVDISAPYSTLRAIGVPEWCTADARMLHRGAVMAYGMRDALRFRMISFIIRYSFRLPSNSLRLVAFVREEYAPNIRSHATRFDTRERAEDRAYILREDMHGTCAHRGMTGLKIDILEVSA